MTTLKLGGVEYRVEYTSAIADYGHTDTYDGVIYINTKYPYSIQQHTLWHEIGHLIMEVRGRLLRDTYDKLSKEEMEEAIVELLGTGVSDILQQNFNVLYKEG